VATLTEVIAELSVLFTPLVFEAPKVNPEPISRPGVLNPSLYHFHYLEEGIGGDQGKPIGRETKIPIYVWDEGEPTERAVYDQVEPVITVDKDTIASNPAVPTIAEVARLYSSQKLRERVLGALLVAATAWFWTDGADTNYAAIMRMVSDIRRDSDPFIKLVMGHLCGRQDALAGTITDVTIQSEVNGLKDKLITALYE